jgi:hypothetical protein
MRHVFFSYVREDEGTVNKAREYCEASGISVWMDRESLRLGEPWMQKLRTAICEGAFFVLFLSKHVAARPSSVVYREINIALEELRRGPGDQDWFLPLRLDDCPIPKEVAEFTYVDLFPDFNSGAVVLVNRLLARLLPELSPEHIFILGVRYHIGEKLRHFTEMGATIREEILGKWQAILDEYCLNQLTIAFRESYGRMKATGQYQLDLMIEPGDCGRVILLSIAPNRDRKAFLRSLPAAPASIGNTYIDFIIAFRRSHFHVLSGWVDRDFAHIIYFDDPENDLLDILFLESPRSRFEAVGQLVKKRPSGQRVAFQDAAIYPTSLLTAIEAGTLADGVYSTDSRATEVTRDRR